MPCLLYTSLAVLLCSGLGVDDFAALGCPGHYVGQWTVCVLGFGQSLLWYFPRQSTAVFRCCLLYTSFPARSFEELFQGVKAIDWEDWIAQDGEFPVKGYSISSQLHSVPACQSIVKKAVSQHLSEQYGLEWLPETGYRTQIQFSILKDQVTVALDTSGEGLYKRGYRAVGVAAPLRETLAAALVILSRYLSLIHI